MTNALEIKNLNKLYDNKNYALSNISFNVQQGEILHFWDQTVLESLH